MLFTETTPTGLRGAVRGFLEGVVLFLVIGTATRLVANRGALLGPEIFLLAGFAGIAGAIGRGISGRLLGAALGTVVGLLLATFLGRSFLDPRETREPLPPGEVFILKGPGLDGQTIDLLDYRGKVVLVDFWATWCQPCVQELPRVRAAYEKYHENGFEVIGVSLDQDVVKLKDFLKEEKIPWPQIFFDEDGKRGWANPLAAANKIQGIPATFLIDREGRLAVVDVRGPSLEKEVARIVGNGEDGITAPFRIVYRNNLLVAMIIFSAGVILGALAGALLQRQLLLDAQHLQNLKEQVNRGSGAA